MGKTVSRGYCYRCHSKDNLCVFIGDDGNTYKQCKTPNCVNEKVNNTVDNALLTSGNYQDIPERGLKEEYCRLYNYQVASWNGVDAHIANYFREDKVVAQKIKLINDKKFFSIGSITSSDMFGWNTIDKTKDSIYITEGEIDAISLKQTNPDLNVVSIRGGAGGQTEGELKAVKDELEEFKKIYLVFDSTDIGPSTAKACAKIFTPGKVYIVNLRYKDPNEFVKKQEETLLLEDIANAKQYIPESIKIPTKEEMFAPRAVGRDLPYPILNKMIRGIKEGKLYMFMAGPKAGKSTITKDIILNLLKDDLSLKVGLAYLEEPLADSALSLAAMDESVPYYEYEEQLNTRNLESGYKFYDNYLATGRIKFLDASFMALSGEELIYNLTVLINLGYKLIVLDHITMITYDMVGGQSERKDIDVLMKNLRKLSHQTGATFLTVCHLKRPNGGESWDQGREITMSEGRGSGSYEQLCDVMIGIERNMQSETEKGKTKLKVLANRITGMTGYADVLYYIENKGILQTSEQLFK